MVDPPQSLVGFSRYHERGCRLGNKGSSSRAAAASGSVGQVTERGYRYIGSRSYFSDAMGTVTPAAPCLCVCNAITCSPSLVHHVA